MSEKDGIPGKLWDVITTFTESAQQAAVRKAMELSFDLEAGQIPFQETLINLSHTRDVLRDAIERARIVQLPLKLQYRLLTEATKVKSQFDSLLSGVDSVLPLENAVDDLSATIWQFNLQNISDNVLAFDSKMNELKSQEAQIKKVLSEARRLEKSVSRLGELESEALENFNKIHQFITEAAQHLAQLGKSLQTVQESERSALSAASIIKEHEEDISRAGAASRDATAEIVLSSARASEYLTEISKASEEQCALKEEAEDLLASIQASTESAIEKLTSSFEASDKELRASVAELVSATNAEMTESVGTATALLEDAVEAATSKISTLEATVQAAEAARQSKIAAQLITSKKEFDSAIEETVEAYNQALQALEGDSEKNIKKHDEEATRLTEHLAELESRIRQSIERATGYTLFHSFQKRQLDLAQSKFTWLIALLSCVVASAVLSWFFIHSLGGLHEINALFFMKLSISLPIIFAITFCSVQYSKERRLEEEYAFKSSISISLEPYQKLVGQLVDNADPAERAKYTAFIISSINRVFTSPTGLVFDSEENDGATANNLLKTAGNVAETLVKLKTK